MAKHIVYFAGTLCIAFGAGLYEGLHSFFIALGMGFAFWAAIMGMFEDR